MVAELFGVARIAVPSVLGLAVFALWVWAVLDVIATDNILIRNLDKTMWLILVVILPTVGAVAWIALGRPANAGFAPGANYTRPTTTYGQTKPAPRGIEDCDEWSNAHASNAASNSAKERRLMEWEAELAKREVELDDD